MQVSRSEAKPSEVHQVGALLALLIVAGCVSWGGVPDAELPAQPIAIYYRTPEEARLRAEAAARRVKPAVSADGPTLVGKAYLRADTDALGRFLANAFGTDRGGPTAHLGRLALLDARSGELTFVEGALRGAVPQAWSPDHGALLFAQPTAPESGDVQIFEWSTAAKTVRRVTVGPPIHSQACYGPDARIVVTAVELTGGRAASRVRISQPGGRAPFADLSDGKSDHSPTCAPDGRTVAFARTRDARHSEIWVREAPFDGAPRALAPGRDPRFGESGDWLVYTATAGRAARIYRIRGDGSGRAPIGGGAGGEGWPSASPNGKLVAYVASEPDASSRLLVRRFDGSGDRILLATGEGEHPVW
jgi:WD40 repeat protein